MGAICNGIALYNNQPVFDSTFLAFSNYMLPALRMRAMMNIPALSIFTHDSISIGQDGPTHQPIEQIAQLRNIIGLTTFRPANNTEAVSAYKYFFETHNPTAIIFSKSNLAESQNIKIEDADKGGYIIYESSNSCDVIIISTGTDTEFAINVAKQLTDINVRVVSIPCESVFDSQSAYYKNKILPKDKFIVALEASNDTIWYKYIEGNGLIINVNSYQGSGNGSEVYKQAGFDENKIAKTILRKIKTNQNPQC